MKRIYDKSKISEAISKSRYSEVLQSLAGSLSGGFFLIEYEEGEFVCAPDAKNELFQIIVSGMVSIYFIRDDGSSYSLASSETDVLIGISELFEIENNGVFAEANGNVTCLAFLMEENRDLLMNNNLFLRMIAKSSSIILDVVTKRDAIPTSLKERILAYMNYKCPDKILKGVEKAAFQLHCSPRQLQRVLNELTDNGETEKIGKGAYRLRLN